MKRFVKCKDWIICVRHCRKRRRKKLCHLHYAVDIFSLTCSQFKITRQSTEKNKNMDSHVSMQRGIIMINK